MQRLYRIGVPATTSERTFQEFPQVARDPHILLSSHISPKSMIDLPLLQMSGDPSDPTASLGGEVGVSADSDQRTGTAACVREEATPF